MTFKDLNLIEPILAAVAKEGYEAPSPIQAEAIPMLLQGRDLLGCAQTGTGKTAAFAIPILQKLYKPVYDNTENRKIKALVLTPTRELALQISESFKTYGCFTGLYTTVVFGGVKQTSQVAALRRGVDILVATPGRLNDLIRQNLCDLSSVNLFVLDEADRMLDMGFIQDVKRIIAKISKERQTLLFSATMPDEIMSLASSILNDPVTVKITPVSSTVETIEQSVYFVDRANKASLLEDLLKDDEITSVLVFARTKHGADKICRALNAAGVEAGAIHSSKSQNVRQAALRSFKNGKIRALVATDIAARGIDVDKLSHVINYDLPEMPETYVHRIGRTGRAGLSGVAISFCDVDERAHLKEIQKLIRVEIPVNNDHAFPAQNFVEAIPKQTMHRSSRPNNNNSKEMSSRKKRNRMCYASMKNKRAR